MEKFAIIYDFDFTLCTDDAPMFGLFPYYDIDGKKFFEETENKRIKNDMEALSAYMYYLRKMAIEKGKPLTEEILQNTGKEIKFYPGIETWFDRINSFGKENGFEVEHYIISSGLLEIIEGSKISKYFKKIFASSYFYDEKGFAVWPRNVINYTNKTQFIFRINKGLLNNCDDNLLNGVTPKENRLVKYENMIYIGDGYTDVPSMKTMLDKNGYAIGVYDHNRDIADGLIGNHRCNEIAEADYSENSKLETVVKKRILQQSLLK